MKSAKDYKILHVPSVAGEGITAERIRRRLYNTPSAENMVLARQLSFIGKVTETPILFDWPNYHNAQFKQYTA